MQNQLQDQVKELEEQLHHKKQMLRSQGVMTQKSIYFIPLSIIIAGAIIGGGLAYGLANNRTLGSGQQPPTENTQQVAGAASVFADDDAYLGKENAPVTIIEFSDFQCPFCRKFWKEILPQIKQAYIDTGKARFVYRDFPLVSIHPGATPAAQGAECAREQGKFWEMHDAIFAQQDKQGGGTIQFTADDVKKWAAGAGLDMLKFNQCLDSGKYKQEIEKDLADGSAAGVSGTPATFINGRPVSGAQPFAAFKVIIDEELKKLGK